MRRELHQEQQEILKKVLPQKITLSREKKQNDPYNKDCKEKKAVQQYKRET